MSRIIAVLGQDLEMSTTVHLHMLVMRCAYYAHIIFAKFADDKVVCVDWSRTFRPVHNDGYCTFFLYNQCSAIAIIEIIGFLVS